MSLLSTLLFILMSVPLFAVDVQKYSLPLAHEMQRADVYVANTAQTPRGVLVLCPGRNGSAEDWVRQRQWQDFAQTNHLALVGISFASHDDALNQLQGYTIAALGSGQLLLDAVHQIYGRDLPIILYGFSAGAMFTNQFADWKPDRVIAWCACAGENEVQTIHDHSPPGIISCGEYDVSHYGAGLSYFKKGRALGKPWLWISVPKTEHTPASQVEEFARQYFHAILEGAKDSCWVDIDYKKQIPFHVAAKTPSVSAWLPSSALFKSWTGIHEP